jgi:adenylate cyclase
MNPHGRFNPLSFLPAAVLVAGLLLMLLDPGSWRVQSLTISLQLAAATHDTEPSSDVTFVNIDEASLDAAGDWPWPRTQIAQLVHTVAEAEPRAILLALPFEGPDAAAPQRALEAWIATGAGRAGQTLLTRVPDTDAVLLEVLGRTETTLGLMPGEGPAPAPVAAIDFESAGAEGFLSEPMLATQGPIARAAPRAIPLALRQDFLGRPAGAFLVVRAGEEALPAAGLMALLAQTDEPVRVLSDGTPGMIAFVDPVGVRGIEAAGRLTPTLPDGSILFRGDLTLPQISAGDALTGASAELIRGRTVVIGSTLPGVSGGPAFGNGLSAAEAAGLAAAQVAAGLSPSRPFLYKWVEVLIVLVLGAIIISLAQARRPWIGFAVGAVGAGGAFAASVVLLTSQAALFDGAATGLVLLVTSALTLVVAEGERQTRHQRLSHAVHGKLPFGAPARLSRNPRRLLEHAESRKVTVLSCGIRDFEDLQDLYKDDPDGLAGIVQQFQELIGEQVRRLGGAVDRYGGDTVVAFWNAPMDDPDHPLQACDCALRLVDSLEALNQTIEGQAYRTGKPFSPIHIGIGINTGRAVAGNVGSRDRPAYSLVGETVEISRQLLEASADYGPAIVVAEHTYQAVKNRFALLEIDKIAIPHRTFTVRVFALLGNPVTKASPRFRALEDAHEAIFEAYRSQNWSLADALIAECRKLNGAIPSLYDLYERRIAYYRQFPPGPDWDGAFSIPVV